MRKFNDWLGLHITDAVGTMWCAYVFAGLALVSLPTAIAQGVGATVTWLAQTFLQLVLLSVILVGQNLQSQKHDELASKVADIHQHHFGSNGE